MTAQFTAHQIEAKRFAAIDGSKLTGEKSYWSSVLGFNTSQVKVLEQAVQENHKTVMVLEDDAQLHPEFKNMVEHGMKQLPHDWKMCYLGGSNTQVPAKLSDNIAVCKETLSTTGYLVRVDFARDHMLPTMLAEYQSKEVDAIFRDIQKTVPIHIFNPRIVYQYEDFSDIQQIVVNYHHQRDF
jgi:GR25 family glycosyltransferase involved in LPS biosynthesis